MSTQQPQPQLVPQAQQAPGSDPVARGKTADLIQRAIGALGGLALALAAGAAIATGGIPEEPLETLLLIVPLVLGVFAVGGAAAPVGLSLRAIGLGMIAAVAMVSFAAGLLMAAAPLLIVGSFAGALLLLAAAAVPLIFK